MAGHGQHVGRISIPYLARDGHPLQIRFRCFEDHNHRDAFHGKYNTVSGDPARLFNVGALDGSGSVIHVTEGEFDAMILSQEGLPAIGVPGVNSFKPHFYRLLAGFNRVWVWADPDEAGGELVSALTKGLRQAKPVPLKVGDVTETFLDGGRDALHDLIGE